MIWYYGNKNLMEKWFIGREERVEILFVATVHF